MMIVLQAKPLMGDSSSSRSDEPKCTEFLSALAAGNGAKLIIQITTERIITPLTIALAVATKQTGGRFICIIPHHNHHHEPPLIINPSHHHHHHHLKDVMEFVRGNPCDIIRRLKKIDFIVINGSHDDDEMMMMMKLMWENIDVNPRGCLVVITNIISNRDVGNGIIRRRNLRFIRGSNILFKENYETVTLPVGDGIELIKIRTIPLQVKKNIAVAAAGQMRPIRRYRRFHVTYEN